jgi:hypothetical protein
MRCRCCPGSQKQNLKQYVDSRFSGARKDLMYKLIQETDDNSTPTITILQLVIKYKGPNDDNKNRDYGSKPDNGISLLVISFSPVLMKTAGNC